ncbi:uncharacterized protein LAESUDRAFT_713664 [Laetiporus sulphureus 93-53]|uniref:F-box domain-containing protein n=1 Tax=Laetiporus sulphureus 93-53 TaxID=1314785 RepID=A0A165EJ32_9APHY|nr:uncharacterized protein LAESUDRAFT_713664 [Laetiporus sulphureus 93-53]KZT07156.1 hypothetical protein LAESUDRAFT_713664 [Laetiporus sulphureus 93-53]
MSLVALNTDILTAIVSFLSTDEAFQLSLTTKQFHAIAMRQAFRIINLKHLGHVKQVCTLLLQEPVKCLVLVRELRISSAALKGASKPTIARFTALLSHPSSVHIHSLGLGSIEWLLVQQPSCADAVAVLPNLTQLELWGVGSDSLAMVEKLTSKPHELALQFGLHFHPEDPIPALFSESRDTPTENSGSSTMSSTTTLHRSPPNSCSQWSSLSHLSLMDCKLPMSVFVLAFPNIKRICLRQVTSSLLSSLPSQADGICWPHLDFIDMGDVTYSHPWNVTCPVRHLVLRISRALVFSKFPLSLVETTMPVVLELEMGLELHARFWKMLAKVGKRLRYLIIVLKDAGTSPSCDYAQKLNRWKVRLLEMFAVF